MATNIIEKMFIEIGLDFSKLAADADKAIAKNKQLESGMTDTEKASAKTKKAVNDLSDTKVKAAKNAETLGKSITGAAKAFTKLFSTLIVASGFAKLIGDIQRANNELGFLEKNLNTSSKTLKAWQGAAAMSGGSAEGMTASMTSLKQSMNGLVMFGDTSMLPYFNALGVAMVDSYGKTRDMNDVMLDLADSLSAMPRDQAYTLGKQMGFDDGTINTLVQGRKELEEILAIQKSMYQSSEEELAASRELSKQQAILNAHWESMKTLLANTLIPVLTKVVKVVNEWFSYIQQHEATVRRVFEGLSIFIGMVLIPMFAKALLAAIAFIAPFAPFILVVAALGAAFVALYEDYATWAEGGKSLFNWGAFKKYIDDSTVSTKSLGDGFAYLLTGYKSWSDFAKNFSIWEAMKAFLDDIIWRVKTFGSIMGKVFSGDFKGAWDEYTDYISKTWNSISDRVTGAVDIATGQEVGTLKNVDMLNKNNQSLAFGADAGVVMAGGGGRRATEWDDLKIKRVNTTYNGKKVIESIGGGETEQGTKEFAKTMQDKLGSRLMHFGAFNDVYHKQKSPNSGHARGLKFDMTLKNDAGQKASQAEGKKLAPGVLNQMRAELNAMGFKEGKDYTLIDEYSRPSSKATAGHIDFGWKNKEAAARYAGMVTNQVSSNTQFRSSKSKIGRADAIAYFMSKGWTHNQAAGLAANLEVESGNWNHQAVGDSGKAYGLAQWHPDRQRKFSEVNKGKNIRQSTPQEQLAFVDWELRNTHKSAGEKLRNSRTAAQAGEVVSRYYEIPADKNGQAAYRARLAEQAAKATAAVAQTQQMQAAKNSVTNQDNRTVSVVLNGGVHVASSASTIDGTVSDGFNAVNNRTSQLYTGMS